MQRYPWTHTFFHSFFCSRFVFTVFQVLKYRYRVPVYEIEKFLSLGGSTHGFENLTRWYKLPVCQSWIDFFYFIHNILIIDAKMLVSKDRIGIEWILKLNLIHSEHCTAPVLVPNRTEKIIPRLFSAIFGIKYNSAQRFCHTV